MSPPRRQASLAVRRELDEWTEDDVLCTRFLPLNATLLRQG
jgi:hypothetical protein